MLVVAVVVSMEDRGVTWFPEILTTMMEEEGVVVVVVDDDIILLPPIILHRTRSNSNRPH